MNLGRPWPTRLLTMVILSLAGAAFLSACAPIRGFPQDPENTSATLAALIPYFDGTEEKIYLSSGIGTEARTQKRNEIVLARMRAYNIAFSEFQRRLYGDSNTVTLGSDLIALILAGLTATTGDAATKAALGAASAGVLGASAAINKDLYYQKTIPALLTQMEADRLRAQAVILQGLTLPNSQYSLMQAYIDLDAYQNAGSIPSAISSITRDAGNAKQDAQDAIIAFRRTAGYIKQLPDVQAVQAQVKMLTDQQFSALAMAMEAFLPTRPPGIQQLVKTIDPKGARLTGNGKKAKQVINAWVGEEDMTPENKKEWTDAIANASK